jgi:hypothetical protein
MAPVTRPEQARGGHTVVAVDDAGCKLGQRTIGATTADHLGIPTWTEQFGADNLRAVEDCRHPSRRLERDLLGAAQRIVRVPPKLMAHVRDSACSYGKSGSVCTSTLREVTRSARHVEFTDAKAVRCSLRSAHRRHRARPRLSSFTTRRRANHEGVV